MVRYFSPNIYPVRFWVGVGLEGIERFECSHGKDLNPPNDVWAAVTYFVREKEGGFWGVLTLFETVKEMTVENIAHETTHAARFIWDHLGEGQTGVEADAYLVGWLAKCVDETRFQLMEEAKNG